MFAAACHYVLRRAVAEPDFLSVLEGLPDYRDVEMRDDASSIVLGADYPKVLRAVRRNLRGKSAVTNFGGSHLLWYWGFQRERHELASTHGWSPGKAGGIPVISVRGANIRSIAWLTQAICGSNTRWVVWVAGTNDLEFVPPAKFDDRPWHISNKTPPRLDDRSGKPSPNALHESGLRTFVLSSFSGDDGR